MNLRALLLGIGGTATVVTSGAALWTSQPTPRHELAMPQGIGRGGPGGCDSLRSASLRFRRIVRRQLPGQPRLVPLVLNQRAVHMGDRHVVDCGRSATRWVFNTEKEHVTVGARHQTPKPTTRHQQRRVTSTEASTKFGQRLLNQFPQLRVALPPQVRRHGRLLGEGRHRSRLPTPRSC